MPLSPVGEFALRNVNAVATNPESRANPDSPDDLNTDKIIIGPESGSRSDGRNDQL